MNLADISNEKRNLALENVFFHDIMNRMGAFSGIIEIIKKDNQQERLNEYIDLLGTIGEMVIEEIRFQRELKSAENHELIMDIKDHNSSDIIESVRKQILYNPVMNSRILDTSNCSLGFKIKTDITLLRRILLNMVKNAAEATPQKGTITIYCSRQSEKVLFCVNNPGVIPADVKLQIFQRSFSTKGLGRGLGTYSMKLFGENYLKGKVCFTSDAANGTTFTIELPISEDQT
jgi:signal transduction histidine kinase